MKFRDLAIGQSFDFVSDTITFNSFYDQCVKVSTRTYKSGTTGSLYRIGSIDAKVYHVNRPLDAAKPL